MSRRREQLIVNLILYDNSGILKIHYKFTMVAYIYMEEFDNYNGKERMLCT